MFSRRELIRLGTASVGTLALRQFGLMPALAESATDYRALVCVFLFGGNDSNNTVIPTDDASYKAYQSARGALALSTLPLLTMLAAALLRVEALTLRKTTGVVIATLGVATALLTGLATAPADGLMLALRISHVDEEVWQERDAALLNLRDPAVGITVATSYELGLSYWHARTFRASCNYVFSHVSGNTTQIRTLESPGEQELLFRLGIAL